MLPAHVPLPPVHALLRGIFRLVPAPESTSSHAGASPSPSAAEPEGRRERAAALRRVARLPDLQANTRLHHGVSQLSAQERWVLGLAYYRELSHCEVSVVTGLPLGSVKSLILRAQVKLRALLAESMADTR